MQTLILYSTLGCHLCELALDEIHPCINTQKINVQEVDIAGDPELVKKYGTSIPVLHSLETQVSLYWPFDQQAVAEFIVKNDVRSQAISENEPQG